MKILVLAPDYPKPGRLFGGIFNERSVLALKELCDSLEVLAPRPYAPPLISSCVPRWKIHALTPSYEVRNGVAVHRPAVPIIPKIGSAFWLDHGAFLWCRQTARTIYRRTQFDAIMSFDLSGPGGMAWRIGRDLGHSGQRLGYRRRCASACRNNFSPIRFTHPPAAGFGFLPESRAPRKSRRDFRNPAYPAVPRPPHGSSARYSTTAAAAQN